MKASKSAIGRALDQPEPAVRFYLFYGPDESQSRALANRLLKGLAAEKFIVATQAAKADPALLADEASAIGLFGGKRAIWLEPAGDEIAPAVEALLAASGSESPVIAIAGTLRKTSPLVKLAEADPLTLACISYEPDQRDIERSVDEMARCEGLRLGPGMAARVAAAASNDRGIIVQELAKIALYVGATAETPAAVDRDTLDAIAAGGDGDSGRLIDLALTGEIAALSRELDAGAAKADPVSILRALQRRLLMLVPLRARVDGGERPHDAVASAGKAVFWKEKAMVAQLVGLWDSSSLARVLERSGDLERHLMSSAAPPANEALGEELIAIARLSLRR